MRYGKNRMRYGCNINVFRGCFYNENKFEYLHISRIQIKTCSVEIHLVNSIPDLKTRNG